MKLRIDAPELADLPWEFLHDLRTDDYICLRSDTSLVRYLPVAESPRPLMVTAPLRILGMIANPKDHESLNVALERQRLELVLSDLLANGLVELTWLEDGSWRALQWEMSKSDWHVFHFIGHGGFDRIRDEGFLAFVDDTGMTERIQASQLARLLDKQSLRLALLNACDGAKAGQTDIFSSTAAALARRSIPAVLAMQYAISDAAALEFSRSFYRYLTSGLPVDAAVTEARRSLSFARTNSVEWGIPVLYLRSADGKLFDWMQREDTKTSGEKEKGNRKIETEGSDKRRTTIIAPTVTMETPLLRANDRKDETKAKQTSHQIDATASAARVVVPGINDDSLQRGLASSPIERKTSATNGRAVGRGGWSKLDRTIGLITTIVVDIQLLTGLVLWAVGGGMGLVAANITRTVEHPVWMIIAIAVMHIGQSRVKKAADGDKARIAAITFIVTGLLVAVGVARITGVM